MSDYIIEMNHITKRFPGIVANDDVSIQVKRVRYTLFWGEWSGEVHFDEYAVWHV